MNRTRQFILSALLLANAYHILVVATTLNHEVYAIALQAVLVEETLFVLACCAARDTEFEAWVLRYNTLCGTGFLIAAFALYLAAWNDFGATLLLCAGLFRYALAFVLWEPAAYRSGIVLSLAFILYGTMQLAVSGLAAPALALLTTPPLPTVMAALLATLALALLLGHGMEPAELPVVGPVGALFLVLGVAFVTWALVGALNGLNGLATAVILVQGAAAAAFGAAKLRHLPPPAAAEPREEAAVPAASQYRQNPPQDQRRAGRDLVGESREVVA